MGESVAYRSVYLADVRYPIGIQDFRKLRKEGYHYIDKSSHIAKVLESGNVFFLSRPRRFGKSLLLSTLNELHSGDSTLFRGLWANRHWDFAARQRPVVWLKFALYAFDQHGLAVALSQALQQIAREHGVQLPGIDYKTDFAALIKAVADKYQKRVVLLVDEYDKPIIDYLDDIPRAEENRAVMKQFYGVLKDCDSYLELVFITGVSAFSKVSIFSDLNNLFDLTLGPVASGLVGLTESELDENFAESLANVDRTRLREHYNGYSWTGEGPRVYNPWSIFNFFAHGGRFRNFWYATGTPNFLVKELKRRRYADLAETVIPEISLTAFDIENLDPAVVMFQTGYLTLVNYDERKNMYTLDYPNREVRTAFLQGLLKCYLRPDTGDVGAVGAWQLIDAFEAGDIDAAMQALNGVFAVLPYEHWNVDHEFLFHAVVQLVFTLVGIEVRLEVHTAGGRCDILIETSAYIYAFEFKRDKSAAEALEQIKSRGYLQPYAGRQNLKRIAVGVNFSTEKKAVSEWVVEHL